MRLQFEKRYYFVHEIQKMFCIKEKTWRMWMYDKAGDKMKNGKRCKPKKVVGGIPGVFKMPGTNYYVVDPEVFQEWFMSQVGDED